LGLNESDIFHRKNILSSQNIDEKTRKESMQLEKVKMIPKEKQKLLFFFISSRKKEKCDVQLI
jgi:hypothetical protein